MVNTIVYPECSSPKTKEDYESLVQCMVAAVIEEEKNQDWKPFSFNDHGESGFNDLKIFDKPMPGSELDAMKVIATVPDTMQNLVDYLWDLEKRKKVERDLSEVTLIEQITPDVDVIRTRYSAPFPVKDRQFVLLRARVVKDGISYIVTCSINHPCAVEEKNYVLAVSKFNATVVRPAANPQHSIVARYSQMDPKGSVPKFAANMSKSKLGDFMICLRKAAVVKA